MCSICDIEVLNDPAALTMPKGDDTACTCPGWCFFNPGQHHANCKCEAKEHVFREGGGA